METRLNIANAVKMEARKNLPEKKNPVRKKCAGGLGRNHVASSKELQAVKSPSYENFAKVKK